MCNLDNHFNFENIATINATLLIKYACIFCFVMLYSGTCPRQLHTCVVNV